VGQFVDAGTDATGRFWLVMRDVRKGSPPLLHISDVLRSIKTKAACEDAILKAAGLAQAEAKKWATSKGL
jgi:hypothetical protein